MIVGRGDLSSKALLPLPGHQRVPQKPHRSGSPRTIPQEPTDETVFPGTGRERQCRVGQDRDPGAFGNWLVRHSAAFSRPGMHAAVACWTVCMSAVLLGTVMAEEPADREPEDGNTSVEADGGRMFARSWPSDFVS
jgi:hypothetical protein